MSSIFQYCVLLVVGLPLWWLLYILFLRTTSTYFNLNGPPSDHWFFGNQLSMVDLKRYSTGQQQMLWLQKYGRVVRYSSIFRRTEIMLADPKGIEYVYKHPHHFDLSDASQEQMRSITGESIITAQGEQHMRLRRILLPFFGAKTSRHSHQVFANTASAFVEQLVPKLSLEPEGSIEIDAFDWCNRVTLDVIGSAGFGYRFGAVDGGKSELLVAWLEMMDGFRDRSLWAMLMFLGVTSSSFPIKSRRQRTIARARKAMYETGKELLRDKRLSLKDLDGATTTDNEDILTGLLRLSISPETPKAQRLSDAELCSQIPLLLLAGSITTASTLTWALIILAQSASIQDRLRKELLPLGAGVPTPETLNKLPFLEAFIKELLRMYPAVPTQYRKTLQDTVVPLGNAVRGIDGEMMQELVLRKGTLVFIPSLVVNLSKDNWGSDADKFNPDRHITPAMRSDSPGVWGDMLTFGGGERACLGYRFAILQLKTVLCVLLRQLSFHQSESEPQFERFGNIGFSRMRVRGEETARAPIKVKLYTE